MKAPVFASVPSSMARIWASLMSGKSSPVSICLLSSSLRLTLRMRRGSIRSTRTCQSSFFSSFNSSSSLDHASSDLGSPPLARLVSSKPPSLRSRQQRLFLFAWSFSSCFGHEPLRLQIVRCPAPAEFALQALRARHRTASIGPDP